MNNKYINLLAIWALSAAVSISLVAAGYTAEGSATISLSSGVCIVAGLCFITRDLYLLNQSNTNPENMSNEPSLDLEAGQKRSDMLKKQGEERPSTPSTSTDSSISSTNRNDPDPDPDSDSDSDERRNTK